MNHLSFASIKELQAAFAKKEISPQEFLDHCIKRFAEHDKTVGSALEIFDRDSILEDRASQGKLFGIPGILKDNIAQENRTLTCASKVLQGFSSTYDATATARLKQEGALLIGRANCDEFAMGSSTETSAYQKTVNPWDHSTSTGRFQWRFSSSSCCRISAVGIRV